MKLSRQVICAIDDGSSGKLDAALLHACIAIDTTSKRLYPNEQRVGTRYVACLRRYYWLIEPMLGAGINLDETKFENIHLKKIVAPDLAEIIYHIFRCSAAHGDEIPEEFSVIPTYGGFNSSWGMGYRELHMPDRIVWALLAVAVFSKVNKDERCEGDHYLSLGDERFPVREWWGREDDFRSNADRYNQVRVKMDGLGRLQKAEGQIFADRIDFLQIINPPMHEIK